MRNIARVIRKWKLRSMFPKGVKLYISQNYKGGYTLWCQPLTCSKRRNWGTVPDVMGLIPLTRKQCHVMDQFREAGIPVNEGY